MRSSVVIDQFAYVRAYVPRFPKEDRTNTETEMGRLLQMMRDYGNRDRSEETRQWLTISIQEVESALDAYGTGDEERGESLLSVAVEHFRAAVAQKPTRPSFAVASDGSIKKGVDGR